MGRIELRHRDVMNTKPAVRNDSVDLLDSDLASIIDLQGTTRLKSAVGDREDHGLEDRLVLEIEGTIEENALLIGSPHGGGLG
jgi:hypothetical protein